MLPPYADGPGARVVQATALFALGGAGFAAFGAAGAAAGAALVAFGYVALWSRVRVGCDGVRLPPWHGSRFVSYGELERVGVTDRSVTIETKDGETYYLPTQLGLGLVGRDDSHERLSVDIEARAKAWRASGDAPPAEALDPSSEDAAETKLAYVARLRALGRAAGGSDYRAAAIPADLLWSVVEHARATESARAAAAIVLAAGDAAAHERLRAIASASAAPRLRAVIDLLVRRDAGAAYDEELARHLADH